MSRKDGVLALLVVVVWGLNFVVIKVLRLHGRLSREYGIK